MQTDLNKLISLYKSKNYIEVIEMSHKLLLLSDSNNYEIYFYLAHSLMNINQLVKSEYYFNRIIENFPSKYQGYEGLCLIAERKNNFLKAKEILILLVQKYPTILGLHIRYLKVLIKLNGFKKTITFFEEFIEKFNYSEKAVDFFANQALISRDWDLIDKIFGELISKYPNNHGYKYKYGKNLIRVTSLEHMIQFFKEEYCKGIYSYILYKGFIETLLMAQEWNKVVEVANHIYDNGTESEIAETLFLVRIAYVELKITHNLELLINNFLSKNKDFYLVWKVYALLPSLIYDGDTRSLKESFYRWQRVLERFPDNIDANLTLGMLGLELGTYKQTELFFLEMKNRFKENYNFLRGWCLIPFYKKDYVGFIDRYNIFKSKFPNRITTLTYHLLVSLLELGKVSLFYDEYMSYTFKVFSKIVKTQECWATYELNKIKKYTKKTDIVSINILQQVIRSKEDFFPVSKRENISLFIDNSDINDVLMICFSGMDGKRTGEHYNNKGLSDLSEVADVNLKKFDYQGFAHGNKNYNFLLLRDLYNCWYQINTKEYINIILDVVRSRSYKKVVCIGTSAGGFAALMFGQLLKAHLVFAYSPQTFAWTNYATPFNKACELSLMPDCPHLYDIGQLQLDGGGFIPMTYIKTSQNNALDQFALLNLNHNDNNLNIKQYESDKHAMYQVIGKKRMFSEICDIVSEYCPTHNFLTGESLDIESNI